MINPMIILFLLGALQGLIGWIMVKSGLNDENLYVNHIRLAIHFISALGLLCYTFWFSMMLLVPAEQHVQSSSLKNHTLILLVVLVIQLVFGAFMAGLKAANFATTWPSINGEFIPSSLMSDTLSNFSNDPLAVHFIHRTLAYCITAFIIFWHIKAKKISSGTLFNKLRSLPLILVILQVLLGILTVLFANNKTALLWLGVTHQFTGMILLLVVVSLLYTIKSKRQHSN
jgi:cytochrome c oxidase assembly protein subunit 15